MYSSICTVCEFIIVLVGLEVLVGTEIIHGMILVLPVNPDMMSDKLNHITHIARTILSQYNRSYMTS